MNKTACFRENWGYKSFDRKAVFGVQVRELMNPAVVTVEPSSSAALAAG